jgi:hypothetical protein
VELLALQCYVIFSKFIQYNYRNWHWICSVLLVSGCRKLLTFDVSVLMLEIGTAIQSETVLSIKLILRTESKHIQKRTLTPETLCISITPHRKYTIQLSSRIRMELQFHPDPAASARKLSTNLYDIYHC